MTHNHCCCTIVRTECAAHSFTPQALPSHLEERDGKTYKVTRYNTIFFAIGLGCTAIYTPFWLLYVTLRCCCGSADGSLPHGDNLRRMLDSGEITANGEFQPGMSLLMAAVASGDRSLSALLLDRGADVNFKSSAHDGITPLIIAVQEERLKVAELLLKRGADVNASLESSKKVALMFAVGDATTEKAGLAMLRLLLAHGANVNAATIARDEHVGGSTPLWFAAQKGHAGAIRELLASGANIDACCGYGNTALMAAAEAGHAACVKLLLERGADWRRKDCYWRTAHDLSTKQEIRSLLKSAERAAVTPNPTHAAAK
jgi:hypothetical protein